MLEPSDMQAIAQLMLAMEERLSGQMGALEERINTRMDTLLEVQKQEILEQSAANTRILLESYVEPKFQLLAEGHQLLLDTMVSREEFDALQDDVDTVKGVMRSLSRDVAKLKQAQ